MNEISLENPFLKETPLTSTKNKLLLTSGYPEKYTLTNRLFNLELGMTKKRKACGENLFRSVESNVLRDKPATFTKKVKKMKCHKRSIRRDRSRSREMLCLEMSVPDDLVDGPVAETFVTRSPSRRGGVFACQFSPDAEFGSAPGNIPQLEGFSFGSGPPNVLSAMPCSQPPFPQPVFGARARGAGAFSAFKAPQPNSVQDISQIPFGSVFLGSKKDSQMEIFEMPVYNFGSKDVFDAATLELSLTDNYPSNYPYNYDEIDGELKSLRAERLKKVKTSKMQLLNATSMSLIFSSNFKDSNDSFRMYLLKCADDVRAVDPEFILKIALYSRQELHIRSATNFLLSYAAYHENTRPYLEKYFDLCVRLPSDWIEVADLYQILHDDRIKNGSLPSALKKVMVKSFTKFDAYQLAKHNRIKKKKPEVKKSNDTDTESEKESTPQQFTLKQLIRLLHLSSPANEIMCLLGKKYPETYESFKKSGLPGTWDSQKAGQRMKLPLPETWETQISSFGNKSHVWEGLIDSKKLPYMAMLRNLRNLILSGISPKHHEKVLQYITNKNAVINSRQLPLQFYEAFKTIIDLQETKNGNNNNLSEKTIPFWRKKLQQEASEKLSQVSPVLLNRFEDAVSDALEISSLHNLPLVPGKTVVICDVFLPMELRKNKKAFKMCVMMGLMCLKASEDCDLKIINGSSAETVVYDEDSTFLRNVMNTCDKIENVYDEVHGSSSRCALKEVLESYLKQQTILKLKLDQVIYLQVCGDQHVSKGSSDGVKELLSSFLHKYRQIVNQDLLFTHVNMGKGSSFSEPEDSNEKDVYLCGNNAQLLKFIAERSFGNQLAYIENIDSKYDLLSDTDSTRYCNSKSDTVVSPLHTRTPKWHTLQIFISSTFKDMHSERDILIRYVFPELRKRAASVFVKVNEVDLRWGITETDCATKRASELCLLEAQKSDFFVGILGERYGTTYNFDPPDSPELHWVKDYPSGLSITELEMNAGALRENKLAEKRAFFYFRDGSFFNFVPANWKSHFCSENEESKQKVTDLKSKIRNSGVKVLDGYPCRWAGILNDKPVLAGLDSFGKAVLEDLWNAVCAVHENDPYCDDVTEEEACQQDLLESFEYFVERKGSTMDLLLSEIKKESGIFLLGGSPGSGKTAFVVNLLKKLENFSVIKFFIGLTPRSTDLTYMLQYISNSIAKSVTVSDLLTKMMKDVLNNFPDILHEASNFVKNLIIVIDGLDHLETEDQMLDWLPTTLPHGLRVICTASESSYAFNVLCERRVHGTPIHMTGLSNLVQSDRESIVKHYLKLYGKVLDESPFNNQMLLMVTKKDSGIPLYLRMACDYLRSYASFENFMSMLQSLPSILPQLFQEIILQMEKEYSSVVVQTALTLLCITKEGLDDTDLHFVLTFATVDGGKYLFLNFNELSNGIKEVGPDDMLSQVTYCSLVHSVCNFAFGHNRLKRFNLSGSEFEKAVKKFYLNKGFSEFAKKMHFCLAAYYFTLCDPSNDGMWNGRSALAFRGLIYHLYHGEIYVKLAECLSCLEFLKAVFSVEAGEIILEYYSLLSEKMKSSNKEAFKDIDFSAVLTFRDFITKNLHIFRSYPCLVIQQALNEPIYSVVRSKVKGKKSRVIECLSSPSHDARIATLGGFVKNITAAACGETDPVAILGSEDGYLKVFDLDSKRVIRNMKAHTSAVTFICFAGENRLCSASVDNTLCIWSAVDYNLVCVLKGHRHCVSGCCADLSSNILLSSGWDNSVRLWSLRDGRAISAIEDFRCPVNCLDHHPFKQQIACGLWSGNIEIWDTVSLKQLLVLESNFRSVKSLAYTPDGLNIISSYMNSDMLVWSSEQGLKISSLKGHVLPVKSITYSYLKDMVITGGDDCTLKVWPTESGIPTCSITSCKFCPISLMKIVSPDYLVIYFQNSEIWVVDILTGNTVSKMILKSDKLLCFSTFVSVPNKFPNQWTDTSFVFGTQSGNIMIGDIPASSLKTITSTFGPISSVVHNEALIAFGNSNGDVGLMSYHDSKTDVMSGAHENSISSLSFSFHNENLCLLSACSDKKIKFWSIDDWKTTISLKSQYVSKHKDALTCCLHFPTFHDEEDKFLTGSYDNSVILQGETSGHIKFEGLKTSVVSVDFNNLSIIGCGSDASIASWSHDGKLLSYISGIDQSSTVLSFYIGKDADDEFGITLAYADVDGSVQIRKPFQRSFSSSLEGHRKSITSCCSCSTGEILSSSLDGTINLWKPPLDNQSLDSYHTSAITSIALCMLNSKVISSDTLGNIFLWNINTSSNSSLLYAAKKSYIGGYIRSVSWIGDKEFVCAVTQVVNSKEKYFLDIISINTDEKDVCSLQVKSSHYFKSEVLTLDTRSASGSMVAGFKSGESVVIKDDDKKIINISEDWILGTKVILGEDSIEYLFLSLLSGSIRRYNIGDIIKSKVPWGLPFCQFSSCDMDQSPYNSTFTCESEEKVYCGDTYGYLRIYTKESYSSVKVHDDAVTGVSVVDSYIFSSSLDRTVKGWNISTLKQVCQYHSTIPITCLSVGKEIINDSCTYLLNVGTTSGAIYLLKFYPD